MSICEFTECIKNALSLGNQLSVCHAVKILLCDARGFDIEACRIKETLNLSRKCFPF